MNRTGRARDRRSTAGGGQPSFDPVNNACGWAIEQLTGEVMAAPKTIERVQRDWFLTPYR